MLRTDRFLGLIVLAVVVLAVVAVVVVQRQRPPQFRSDDTPEAAVHNYLLALDQRDFARAYEQLSPELPGYPSSEQAFIDDVLSQSYGFGLEGQATTTRIRSDSITAGTTAVVGVEQSHFREGGLLDSGTWEATFQMRLRRERDRWRLVGGDQSWNPCWSAPDEPYCARKDRLQRPVPAP